MMNLDLSDVVPVAIATVKARLEEIEAFRLSFEDEEPVPVQVQEQEYVPSEPTRHNHPTRDIKRPGLCPACDEYHSIHRPQPKSTEKVDIPLPVPPGARRVSSSTSYNPERYVPYRVLWAKVIIRAAYDYALWRDSKDLRLKKFAQDAERWIFESSDLELSFESICFAFDFPVERIRQRTRAMTKDDVKKLEFRERHGRTDPGGLIGGND